VASTLMALRTLARRTPDTESKQSFRIGRSLADSSGRGNQHHPASGGKAWLDSRSIEPFIRGYFVPLIVLAFIGFMAIAEGLALPWSATTAILVGLSVHMAMPMRHGADPHGVALWVRKLPCSRSRA
jgi:hypothetical protein